MAARVKETPTIQDRPVETLSSAECADRLRALEGRRRELLEHLREIRGPQGPATPEDPAPGCGPAYRRVLEAGSGAELIALRREVEELASELALVSWRSDRLRARQAAAEAEERRAAAPAELKKLLATLDARMDTYEATLGVAAEARAALERWTEEVPRLRQAIGDDSRVVSPAQLLRLGTLLNRRLVEIDSVEETVDAEGVRRRLPALFGGVGARADLVDLLGRPDTAVLRRASERLRGLLGHPGEPPSDRAALEAIRDARYRALAASNLELVNDAEGLARDALLAQAHFGGERGRARVEAALDVE
jgi:hypothetical protein